MEFFDVHEQTRYKMVVSRPENLEELSDAFVSADEFRELTGLNPWVPGSSPRTFTIDDSIAAEVQKLCDKLDASKKKSLIIEDEELLDVLKDNYLSDYTHTDKYRRHGNRICYKYKRKKKRATRGDLANLWGAMFYAFSDRYGVYPPHVPRYERNLQMFKAFKKIVGWKYVNKRVYTPQTRKWYRQIWDNPEEYMQ